MVVNRRNRLPAADSKAKKQKYYFSPSLKLQRQAYCLEQLRIHGIRSVFEIGCGEGDLLASLCEPASHIDEFPAEELDVDRSDIRRKIPRIPMGERELHIDKIAGIDVDANRLQRASAATRPPAYVPAEEAQSAYGRRERWEPLRVELWQGSFALYEEALDGYEAVVLSEVIEHLNDDTLDAFGPIVLGRYRPRIVVITTPNYDFSPLFGNNDTGEINTNRTPDPTGRTNRVFRDSDHKFEFTSVEFKWWAEQLCEHYDYTVSFGGVGRASTYLKGHFNRNIHGGDPDMCATQCCVFKRLYANEAERAPRSPRATPLAFLSAAPSALAPVLRAAHIYRIETDDGPKEADEAPLPPTPSSEIRRLVTDSFYDGQVDAVLRDIWSQNYALRRACQGQINVVFDAIAQQPDRFIVEVRLGDEYESPDFYGEEAVWIVRKELKREEPVFQERSWADEVEEAFYEPEGGWSKGDASKGSWRDLEQDSTDSSDASRGPHGGKRGVRTKRDSSDEYDSSGGEGW